jgi:branched-chain amino acid aminotransferase
MNYFNNDTLIYHNGEFVKAIDAKINLYSQSLHYGYSVFEGIRSYKTIGGVNKIFKEKEHFERLRNSALAINMPYPFDDKELIKAAYEVLRLNNLGDSYIRPLVYAPANMTYALNTESYIAIQAWPMQPFLGDKNLRIMTSPFQRPNPRGFMIHAKAGGHYVNSIIASQDAKKNGYDEALLEDMDGYVAEGPGANVFIEKNKKISTPSLGNILPGITRATVLEICKDFGIPVEEKKITQNELKDAENAFFCGTAAEVIGWKSIDDHEFSGIWENSISYIIQQAYKALTREDMNLYEAQHKLYLSKIK